MVDRARTILAQLEAGDRQASRAKLVDDLPLFAVAPRPAAPPSPRRDELAEALDALDPDDMTPRQALEALFALKARRDSAKRP